MKFVQITVLGGVQGVFFRMYSRLKAQKMGLFGFVKNLEEDGVYLEIEGPDKKVDEFVEWCHEGSPESLVEEVKIKEYKKSKEYKDFRIEY